MEHSVAEASKEEKIMSEPRQNNETQSTHTHTHTHTFILCADYTTRPSDMFQELSWFPANKRLKYNKATYKAYIQSFKQLQASMYYKLAEANV